MPAILDNNTIALLGAAFDAAGMRQQAIAHNIANANTPGFRRIAVSFEQQFAAVAQRGDRAASLSLADLAGMRPRFVAADPDGADSAVALDQEVAKLAATTVQQQALIKAVNNQLTLLGSAINEGKR